jgi:hypothetical protein
MNDPPPSSHHEIRFVLIEFLPRESMYIQYLRYPTPATLLYSHRETSNITQKIAYQYRDSCYDPHFGMNRHLNRQAILVVKMETIDIYMPFSKERHNPGRPANAFDHTRKIVGPRYSAAPP